jgi:ubiquinone/menaquinone biosynthesis C-methylase UbiE/DNA-binding MarR family transcriptional regulator
MKRPEPTTDVAALLASLAEPIRLRMLRLLESEELSVGEIAKVVQLPQSTVSRHLKLLADRGWVARRAAGTAAMYRLVLDDLTLDARGVWLAVRPQVDARQDAEEDRRRIAAVLAERRLDSQTFFGQVAGEWDAVRATLFGSDFTARSLLSLIPRGWVIADLGCGTGNVSELLAPHAERVVAIDQSRPMLDAARKRLAGQRNVRFMEGSLEHLPLPNRSIDAAVCALVLHHVQEPVAALREIARVLRPDRGGGVVLTVDMARHERTEYRQMMGHKHLGFTPDALRFMMTEAGLHHPDVARLPIDPAAKGPALLAATGRVKPADR